MRRIDTSAAFRRDFKRITSAAEHRNVGSLIDAVSRALVADEPLPRRYRDHRLTGEWSGHRDCRLKFDLVLIYRKVGSDLLELVRLGTHSQLFGK